jgi:hypothetical protein
VLGADTNTRHEIGHPLFAVWNGTRSEECEEEEETREEMKKGGAGMVDAQGSGWCLWLWVIAALVMSSFVKVVPSTEVRGAISGTF